MDRAINGIVISGPTGAIGMALINLCIEQKIPVLLITREGSARNKNIPKSDLISYIYSDISEYDGINVEELHLDTSTKYDAFIHLAWKGTTGDDRNNMELQVENIKYTLSAVRLAKRLGCSVFIGAGSQAEYGRVEGHLSANTPVNPENGYGMAKLCAGQMSRSLCEQLQMEHIWLRILSIYGPYDGENTMITSALRGFVNHEGTAFTPGEQQWDYMFSGDAAKVIIRLAQSGINGKVYCIGSGYARSLKEYIKETYRVVCESEASDGELGIGKNAYSPRQVMFLCADTSELWQDIGMVEITPFSTGIKKTAEWYMSRLAEE